MRRSPDEIEAVRRAKARLDRLAFYPSPVRIGRVRVLSVPRLFRLRATFSDAQSLNARAPFRRVERAGIDFLIFFSF